EASPPTITMCLALTYASYLQAVLRPDDPGSNQGAFFWSPGVSAQCPPGCRSPQSRSKCLGRSLQLVGQAPMETRARQTTVVRWDSSLGLTHTIISLQSSYEDQPRSSGFIPG